MNQTNSKLMAGILSAMLLIPHAQAGLDLHVAADAKAGGDGAKGSPFQTLTQARDGIRKARKSGAWKAGEPVTVHIGPGKYRLAKTFELKSGDGGSARAPVTYRAKIPGTVRIQGGIELEPTAFVPASKLEAGDRLDPAVRDKVFVYDLAREPLAEFDELEKAFKGAPVAPWLYVDGNPRPLARWPNADAPGDGWATFTKVIDTGLPKPDSADPVARKPHPGSFVFDAPRTARWDLARGVWLRGYWTHDWSAEVIRMASYDKKSKAIALAAPHSYGVKAGTWGGDARRFYAFNLLDELDAPGEWYLDRQQKKLYYYPEKPVRDSFIFLATLTQPLVKITRSKYVRLIHLAFEYGHGSGIVLEQTNNVEIAGCEISNLAGGGIQVRGEENTVRSCDVFNIGTTGIAVRGGDRKSLTPAHNLVVNNDIHHFGYFQRTYASGISVYGCGNVARHNAIHDAPHSAVLYGGNEHLFEFNDVYRVLMETGDAGAFYSGRDWTSQGNILRHNYIHDLGGGDGKHANTMGVYLDDCDGGDTVEGNVFFRAGRAILIGGGRDNPIINNLVVDCAIGLHIDSRGMTWKNWNSEAAGWGLEKKAEKLDYKNSPWSDRYPSLAVIMDDSPREPLHNPIRRNVFVDCRQKVYNFDGNVMKIIAKMEIENNLVVNSSGGAGIAVARVNIEGFRNLSGTEAEPIALGFIDRPARDFTLLDGSRLVKELPSFKAIPFAKIGLVKDSYRPGAPD